MIAPTIVKISRNMAALTSAKPRRMYAAEEPLEVAIIDISQPLWRF